MYLSYLAIYFLVLMVIGFFLAGRNINFESYFFGNRRLGSLLIFFTIMASWIGAASTLATIKDASSNGFRALWMLGIPTLLTIGLFLLLNRQIKKIHFISLPLFISEYYGSLTGKMASGVILFYMILLTASQLVAWGKFVGPFIGQNYQVTVLIGVIVIIIYAFMGGYMSVVTTDGIQLVLLIAAIFYLFFSLKEGFQGFRPGDVSLLVDLPVNILMTVSFTLAWLISPIIWQRIGSAKTPRHSRNGLALSWLGIGFLYVGIIMIGIFIRHHGMNADLGQIIRSQISRGGSLLIFMGISAAIMSTADTAINIGALTLAKDIMNPPEQKILSLSRGSIILTGLSAAVISLRFESIIKTLGLASEILAEGLFVPVIAALFLKKKRPLAGLLSLVLGGGFSILIFLDSMGMSMHLPEWPHSLPYGMLLSLAGFLVGEIIHKCQTKHIIQK